MWPFKNRDLESLLEKTTRVKIHGVIFYIRKISVMDFLDGSQVLRKVYDTYQTAKDKPPPDEASMAANMKKVKKHYGDVFLSAVVEPKLCREEGGDGMYVDRLFCDWDIVEKLYTAIYTNTYGKKKTK